MFGRYSYGTVEVNVVVVITVEERADIERAAQADEKTDGVRMTKSNVRSVISTQAGAADCDSMGRTFAPREIEHVAHDHIFVRVMRAACDRRDESIYCKNFPDRWRPGSKP